MSRVNGKVTNGFLLTKQFGIKHISDILIPNTISDSSSNSILRFMDVDGMGKYIDLGWKKAVEDGYSVCVVRVERDD